MKVLRVIVLEEEGLVRNVLVKALRRWGFACAVPEDENTAWDEVRRDDGPAVILADWHTDLLDCGDFFQEIRNAKPHCHLVAGIPRNGVDGIRLCIGAGAHDFVYRPYNLDEVRVRLHAIRKIMGLPDAPLSFD